jgi:hypothetical protein
MLDAKTKKVVKIGVIFAHFVATTSISRTIALVVVGNLPADISLKNRVMAGIGTFLISSVVADKVVTAFEQQIVETVTVIQTTLDEIKQKQSEPKVEVV